MKTKSLITIFILFACLTAIMGFALGQITSPISYKDICTNNDTRDYEYEAYCDSVWDNDVNYYMDVIMETDEYIEYVEKHGTWWDNEN